MTPPLSCGTRALVCCARRSTSASASALSTSGTYYARIYAKVGGVWRYNASSFSTSPLVASLITPVADSTGFNPVSGTFQWTSVPLAQKYYLYVGTSVGDMEFIKAETDHVTGLIGKSGDPSPVTAFGVYRGIKACAHHRYGDDELGGKTVAIQGCGHVGYSLAALLHTEGAKLIATDIDAAKLKNVVDDFRATPDLTPSPPRGSPTPADAPRGPAPASGRGRRPRAGRARAGGW